MCRVRVRSQLRPCFVAPIRRHAPPPIGRKLYARAQAAPHRYRLNLRQTRQSRPHDLVKPHQPPPLRPRPQNPVPPYRQRRPPACGSAQGIRPPPVEPGSEMCPPNTIGPKAAFLCPPRARVVSPISTDSPKVCSQTPLWWGRRRWVSPGYPNQV